LLRAFAKVIAEQPAVRLILIGDGTARQSLESLASELGIGERVTFTGALPFEEIPRYLKAADAFTFASVTETQGLVTMEAMAAGLPVVAVDGPGTRDIVEHGKQGFLVENDPDALAQGLHELLSDSQQRRRFSKNALKKARTFDIDQLGHELIRVYEQAIEDKRENQYVTLKTEETASQEAASPAQT
jgi:glycosyltransferase involved in cell wall biosynthesis